MRLNKKFLSESLAGSEALKLEDWGAFNIEFRLCLGFKGDGAGAGLQGIICRFGFEVCGQRLLTASGLFSICTVSSLSRDCPPKPSDDLNIQAPPFLMSTYEV